MHLLVRIITVTASPVSLILGLWMVPALWKSHVKTVPDRDKRLDHIARPPLATIIPRKVVERYIAVCGAILAPMMLLMIIRFLFHAFILAILAWILIIALVSFYSITNLRLAFYARQDNDYWAERAKTFWKNRPPAGPRKPK